MKKFISLLLAVLMVMSLVACGKGGASSSTPSGTTSSTPAGSTSGSGAASSTDPEPEPVKLTVGLPESVNVSDYDNNLFTQYMEEKLNIDITFQRYASAKADRQTQLATQAAGNEKLPDVLIGFGLDTAVYQTYGEDGYFVDLAPYFADEDYDILDYWREKMMEYHGKAGIERALTQNATWDGKLYYFPGMCPSQTDTTMNHVYINTTWLQKVGLEKPTTWDEMITVLEAFKTQDPNGNGKADEIPMIGGWNVSGTYCGDVVSWMLNNFLYVSDNYFFNVDDDGNVYVPYDQPEYREALKKITKMVEDGLLSPLFWTISSSKELVPIWTPVDRYAIAGIIAGYPTSHTEAGNPVILEYESLPALEGQYIPVRAASTLANCFITTDCENFDTAMEFLAAFAEDEVILFSKYGEEGVEWCHEKLAKDHNYVTVYSLKDTRRTEAAHNVHWEISGPYVGVYGEYSPLSQYTSQRAKDEAAAGQQTLTDMASSRRGALTGETMKNHITSGLYLERQPKNLFYNVVYSPDETEENGTKITDIKNYMKQARGLFCTGALDINSDADWDAYVKTMYDMGLQTVIDNAQAAWTRQIGK